ncbi:MAG: hypothetical protein CML24_14650 [Rhizobiales bacterium]|nr:hypothetical protein [Hyphomicrobiales bacterium]|tara:strand:+ start:4564 stop:4878 length:315 start_codon:yes stop_codon:yes gene_type:complete
MRTIDNILAPPAASHREEDGDYRGLVVMLNADWRLVTCRDGVQWILQKYRGIKNGMARYEGRSFCRSRAGLVRCIGEKCGEVLPAALAIIRALPPFISGGRADA